MRTKNVKRKSDEAVNLIEIKMKVDVETLSQMRNFEKHLGSPNLTTAVCNVLELIDRLYAYQDTGWQLKLSKKGQKSRWFRLP